MIISYNTQTKKVKYYCLDKETGEKRLIQERDMIENNLPTLVLQAWVETLIDEKTEKEKACCNRGCCV